MNRAEVRQLLLAAGKTEAELEGLGLGKHPAKYRSSPAFHCGIRYDSTAEAMRAAELDKLREVGAILVWFGQVLVRLGVPENKYRPDFLVIPNPDFYPDPEEPADLPWFEDVKGFETPKFRRDRKLWRRYGPLDLHVIRGGKTVEVITGGGRG